MFVPVNCTHCGKPFQVPETALGKLAPCPWCETVVTALPVSAPQPPPEAQPASQSQSQAQSEQAPPAKPQAAAAPLSIDDEPTAKPAPKPPETKASSLPEEPVTHPAPKRWKITLPNALLAVGVVVVVAAATMILRGYGAGRMSDAGWINFTPPDDSFTVAMPSQPNEEDVPANPEGSVTGGKRYSVRGWYSKANVWVAYTDLDPSLVPKVAADKERVVSAGVIRVERDREVARLKGNITNEVGRRLGNGWGIELHVDTPGGNAILWLIIMHEGQHPRLYTLGVEGKKFTPTTPAVAKVFRSFQVNN